MFKWIDNRFQAVVARGQLSQPHKWVRAMWAGLVVVSLTVGLMGAQLALWSQPGVTPETARQAMFMPVNLFLVLIIAGMSTLLAIMVFSCFTWMRQAHLERRDAHAKAGQDVADYSPQLARVLGRNSSSETFWQIVFSVSLFLIAAMLWIFPIMAPLKKHLSLGAWVTVSALFGSLPVLIHLLRAWRGRVSAQQAYLGLPPHERQTIESIVARRDVNLTPEVMRAAAHEHAQRAAEAAAQKDWLEREVPEADTSTPSRPGRL